VNKTRTDRAKEAGHQEGLQQGLQQGRRLALMELLEAQLEATFGPLPPEMLAALRAMSDDRLKQLAIAIPKAKSLADLVL
jgi:flagellar biosynthesis/type III secretory pathway protein FliH